VSFTGKIRLFLIGIAIIPPLLIMAVVYFHSAAQAEEIEKQNAFDEVRKYYHFRQAFVSELRSTMTAVMGTSSFKRDLLVIGSGRNRQTNLMTDTSWLDFMEILDSSKTVVASYHRPGLVGEVMPTPKSSAHEAQERTRGFSTNPYGDDNIPDSGQVLETTEFDLNGKHAAFALLLPVERKLLVYGGCYLDANFLRAARGVVNGDLKLQFIDEDKRADFYHYEMEQGVPYAVDSGYDVVLSGGPSAGYYITASFAGGSEKPIFRSLITVTGIVAGLSTLLAIGLGFFISSRAKREIDNLITATTRVAAGDLNTTVMAYEDGEFSQLADAFSEMTSQLKTAQQKLAISERVAAWQVMGRKIAHEVKNPLTPIAICADDLRRSYQEKQSDFGTTLDNNTVMIKNEVHRLTRLLDHFVGFARMAPAVKHPTRLDDIVNDLRTLYGPDISSGRLVIEDSSERRVFPLDHEQVKQVLVNLIKNGFESTQESQATVKFREQNNGLEIIVQDSGTGFAEEALKRGFEPYLSSKKDGSGLGLVICQRIVADHGGTVEMSNRPEGGAVVSIWIPGE
jgi:signal transduction histidine kinase